MLQFWEGGANLFCTARVHSKGELVVWAGINAGSATPAINRFPFSFTRIETQRAGTLTPPTADTSAMTIYYS